MWVLEHLFEKALSNRKRENRELLRTTFQASGDGIFLKLGQQNFEHVPKRLAIDVLETQCLGEIQ
jgi:hypothetical protein